MRTYGYSDTARLNTVTDNSILTATYVHNALGQRVKKTVGSAVTVYIYDLGGRLIAEHDGLGTMVRDYVRLDGAPVAQIDSGELFSYLHTDHLGSVRMATDDSQTVVWRWDNDAFGSTLADGDPDGDSSVVTVHLRFPGQYYDVEAGLHYNYYRTYDPLTGRYLESDPIGLGGGPNTYGYVGGNPMSYVDPFGLDSLLFDGETLSHIGDDGETVQSWSAVSGTPGTDRSEMFSENTGPIPEGDYSVDPDKINRDRFWKRGWGDQRAWGKVRTLIEPKDGTFTNGRFGMFLHGGAFPGSAGCIDLTSSNDDFHDWLEDLKDPIDLEVFYPRPKLEPLEDAE